jgi:hypothetical protein
MEGESARERGGLDGGRKLHLLVGRSLRALGPTNIRGQDLGTETPNKPKETARASNSKQCSV